AAWFFSTLTVTQAPILEAKRTRQLAVMAVGAAALNLAGCFALVPSFGTMGAAAATLAGWATQAVLYYRASQATRRAPYDLRRIGLIVGVSLPFLAVSS